MHQQLSFFEEPVPPPANKYGLFLAIFPDRYTAEKIIDLGSTLRQTHRLQGRLRPTTHLHVSLLPLGGASDVSATVVEAIGQVCKKVTKVTRPFEIEFNRVMRFRTANALVLADVDRKNTEVINLRESLCAEFAKYFPSRRPLPRFIPHLTLLYDKQELAPKPIEPVSWMVKEVGLVRTEVGMTKYDWLERWALGE